jgi:UDP-4-amino-4,6-dideoxy-N-acetyl-beta-L-altrosamine N-acetyltransferase
VNLRGKKVTLRPMRREDGEEIVRWRNASDVHAQMFAADPPTMEGHMRWFDSLQKRDDRVEFVIVEIHSGRPVGTIGLSDIDRVNRRAEYGILIGEADARGKGLAREASQLILQYAFETLRLHRVYLQVFQENEPAIRLYRGLDFAQEGILRQHVWKDGKYRDVVVMGCVRGGEE